MTPANRPARHRPIGSRHHGDEPPSPGPTDPERTRLSDTTGDWKLWGPYLSERAWATVREDYSAGGDAWDHSTHDHARSKAYRWNEDGLGGLSDDQQRLCLAFAFWNGEDPILKERIFGLNGNEGNHGEDAKEYWWYLDSTPTHSWMRWRYVYPQQAFPYDELVAENRDRSRAEPEFELLDTQAFAEDRYWEITADYAKQTPEDLVVRLTIRNPGPDAATLHVLPTLWFRNPWAWGLDDRRPSISLAGGSLEARHHSLGSIHLCGDGTPSPLHYVVEVEAGGSIQIRLRLGPAGTADSSATTDMATDVDAVLEQRASEADRFYADLLPEHTDDEQAMIARQALAGMLWSKQFYHFDVERWLDGDPGAPTPPDSRRTGRNAAWRHLNNADIISMPDKWEYPWYAAWDLAFHCVALAEVDPQFAKDQLVLLCREWYMHPDGQLPAYEWAFGDVNPPVHAWAALRVFEADGARDFAFLERILHKLLLNFTWWVNRKDQEGDNVFEGGFLGLDNIGPIDRSTGLPGNARLEQSDGTAWMAMYCLDLLEMSLVLAEHDRTYEDLATKFFEHFTYIANAMDNCGLWDDADGFYYDVLRIRDAGSVPLRVRSMVGLLPLAATATLSGVTLARLPDFAAHFRWFLEHKPQHAANVVHADGRGGWLLSIVSPERLPRILDTLFDEREFLSAHGLRSLARSHLDDPFVLHLGGTVASIGYEPGESSSGLFGGNSNWRGPIWFPLNYLLIEALRRFDRHLTDAFTVAYPTGSGRLVPLGVAAADLAARLVSLFADDADGNRPMFGDAGRFQDDPAWHGQLLFPEYFHGDTGAGLGASHQTGWTGLVAKLILDADPPTG